MKKKFTKEELMGMTVNERLFVCGLLEQYLEYGRARNREEMVVLLTQVCFTKEQAEEVVDKILGDPKKFGI